ncbi:MAG: hypothetical protein AAFQ52_21245 [Chloroflexota bacterium]
MGANDEAQALYQQIINTDNSHAKLFSPHFYLIQLACLFPNQPAFAELADWLDKQRV